VAERLSGGARCGTRKRARGDFSARAPAIRIFRRTRQGVARDGDKADVILKATRVKASMMPIRKKVANAMLFEQINV